MVLWLETPRAALRAEYMAKTADFFSFGTNDLTQMSFGFSRDDIGVASFLNISLENIAWWSIPDHWRDGIGQRLIKVGTERDAV